MPYGNARNQGYNNPVVAALEAGNVIINKNGLFMYSSLPPAKGNLVLAFAPVSGGTDSAGNVYPQGFNEGVWNSAGVLINHFGIDTSGNIYIASAAGVTVVFGQSYDGSLLFYDATGYAAGHLNIAIAPAAGNDGLTNTYVEGITVQNGGQILTKGTTASIVEEINAGNPQKFWLSGYANESSGASIFSQLINIGGANEYIQWWLLGPKVTGQTDAVFVLLNSSHNDATNNAFGSLGYIDTTGTVIGMLNWGPAGINGMGQLTAITPGTGTVAIDATAETWHNIPLAATWTALGTGTVPQYRANPDGTFEVKGDLLFTSTGVGLSGSNFFSTAIPALYRPATNQYFDAFVIGGSDTPVITANRSVMVQLTTAGIFVLLNVSSTGTATHTVQAGFKGRYQLAN